MVSIRELDQSYNTEMLDILKNNPMKTGFLELHFDKSPNIFLTTRLWSENFKYYGIFSKNQLAGFGMYLIYSGFINNCYEKVLYIGNFCIDVNYRKKGYIFKLSEFIQKKVPQYCKYGFCIILEGNKRAERYFEQASNLMPFMPPNRFKIGYESRSILILGSKKEVSDFEVKHAEQKDKQLINDFINQHQDVKFLMQEMKSKSIDSRLAYRKGLHIEDYYIVLLGKRIIGMCAAWDVGKFKRTRVIKYKKRLNLIRRIYNFLSLINHYPRFPKDGESIKEVYITDIIIAEDNYLVLKSLLMKIYNDYQKKKYNLINISSYKNDPLLRATKSFFFNSLHSNIYFSKLGENMDIDITKLRKPAIDIALL